jgi:hypothetical protein
MAISALMLPAIGGVFYMLMTVPDNQRTELTATNEVRSAADWITLDAMRAADFTYGDEPVYCTFSWEDRSGAIIYSYEVVYRWDSGKLIRDETVERWENEQWLLDSQYGLAIARNIESYSDVTFNSSVGDYSYLEVYINSSVADESKELEIYVKSRIAYTEDEPTPTPTPHEEIAFSDSFEGDLSKWNDNGYTYWDIVGYMYHDGSHSVMADNYNDGYLTSDNIDLSDATEADFDFWFNKWGTQYEDITLYFYDGFSYNLIAELDGLGGDYNWIHYSAPIDLGTYGISNFRIRFDATLGYGETVWIDELVLTKTVP